MRNSILEPAAWDLEFPDGARIRWMRAADLTGVAAIERDSYAQPWTSSSFRFEIERQANAIALVIEAKQVVRGYACAWWIEGVLQINNVTVAREARRCGYARRLLEALIAAVRRAGGSRIDLEVRPSNQAARALYRNLGFRSSGRRRGFYAHPREDALLLTRRFGKRGGEGLSSVPSD